MLKSMNPMHLTDEEKKKKPYKKYAAKVSFSALAITIGMVLMSKGPELSNIISDFYPEDQHQQIYDSTYKIFMMGGKVLVSLGAVFNTHSLARIYALYRYLSSNEDQVSEPGN